MSPRRTRRRPDEMRPLREDGTAIAEEGPDGSWLVRAITGEAATKTYRCPGCDQEIRPGVPHVVAWRPGAEEDRRHWHRPCWSARLRRGARRRG
jgi:hypothetical protein